MAPSEVSKLPGPEMGSQPSGPVLMAAQDECFWCAVRAGAQEPHRAGATRTRCRVRHASESAQSVNEKVARSLPPRHPRPTDAVRLQWPEGDLGIGYVIKTEYRILPLMASSPLIVSPDEPPDQSRSPKFALTITMFVAGPTTSVERNTCKRPR